MLPKSVTSPQKKGDNMFGLTNRQIAKCKDIYKDEDGYWAILKHEYVLDGYYALRVIHEDTQTEFRRVFKLIKKKQEER